MRGSISTCLRDVRRQHGPAPPVKGIPRSLRIRDDDALGTSPHVPGTAIYPLE